MLLVLLIITVLLLWSIQRIRKYRSIDHFPGPSQLQLLNFALSTNNNDKYNYLINLNERFGPVVKIWMKPFRPMLMVSHQKYVEAILNSPNFVHKTDTYRLFTPIFGEGLHNMNDDQLWRKDRKALGYAFNVKSMEKYAMRYKHHSEKLIDDLTSNTNVPFNVETFCAKYSFNVILDLLVSENWTGNEESKQELVRSINKFLAGYLERAFSTYKKYDFVFKLTSSYKEFNKGCTYARNFVEEILNKHMKMRSNTEENKEDFLTLLLKCNLPHIRTLDHLVTFLLGGTETTGKTIAFCLFELAKWPEVQQKILEEFQSVIGDSDDITFADIQNMHYTEAVVKEVLRMYTLIPMIQRQLVQSVVVDGVTIPEGTDICFNISAIHSSEEYYKNPTKFDPSRFESGNEQPVHPNVFIPFSSGPRDCIGKKVGMTETKFIISYIVKHFEIHPVFPEHKLELVAEFTLTSANGMPVIFKRRVL